MSKPRKATPNGGWGAEHRRVSMLATVFRAMGERWKEVLT